MATIQILERKTICNEKYPLQSIKFQKPDNEGKLHEQKNEVYFRPDAVAVLLVDPDKKTVLLTRQFRLPSFLNGNDSGYLIEAVAGLIDEGESPEQTAHREVSEETGFILSNLQRVGAVYSSAGGITEYVYLFLAQYSSKSAESKGGGLAAEGEDITPVEFGFEEVREKLLSGSVNDAKTLMLLQHFFIKQLDE